MKKFLYRIYLVGVMILIACVSQATEGRNLVRVGYFQNEPIIYKDRKGEPKGLYVDLINKIAEKEKWEVKYIFNNWNQSLLSLKSNEIDLMPSIARTLEREKEMVFSNENILTMWGQVYVKNNEEIEDILDLNGLRVAILKGGINGINFKNMMNAFDISCRLIPVDSYEDAASYVANGRASACVINNTHGRILQKKYKLTKTPIMFNPFKLVFATSKHHGQSSLLNTIDGHIKAWKNDNQSYYYQRTNYWYGEREPVEQIIPQWVFLSLSAAVMIIIIAFVWVRSLSLHISERKKAERAKERLIVKLQNALEEIKTLSGLLPICASCKKIRDDKGYWNQIESYIQQHSDAEFSHGICPECSDKLYGDQDWYIRTKKNE